MQREQFQNAVSQLSVPFARVQMRSLYPTVIAPLHILHKKHETRPNPYEGVPRIHRAFSPRGSRFGSDRTRNPCSGAVLTPKRTLSQRFHTGWSLGRQSDAGGHVTEAITYESASRAPFSRPKVRLAGAECRALLPASLNLLRVFSTRQNVWPVVSSYVQHFRSIIACRNPKTP